MRKPPSSVRSMLAYSPMGEFMASPSEDDSRAAEAEDAAIVRGPLLDANEVNNAASRLLHRGRADLALSGFERAARVGQPNAIASLIWYRVLAGDMGGAISAFEEFGPLAEAFISSQRGQAFRHFVAERTGLSSRTPATDPEYSKQCSPCLSRHR